MKRVIGIVLFLAIAIGAYFVLTKNKYKNSATSVANFAVENVEDVDRITLKDREGNLVDLTKKGNDWFVNNNQKAFAPVMDIFLNETLAKIKIKGPVPKTARNNVIQLMVGNAVHVKVYANDEVIKDYYVGAANTDQTGTYIHIEGASTPYVSFIPGEPGILLPKFPTDAQEWYSKSIFDYKPLEMQSIDVENLENPNESFKLVRKDSAFSMLNADAGVNPNAVKSYFSLFSFKNFEGYAPYLAQSTKDSIKAQPPFMKITVTDNNNTKTTLNVYRKGSFSGDQTLIDKNGNVIVEDVERYFATFTGFDRLVTIQDYTFKKILIPRSFFYVN